MANPYEKYREAAVTPAAAAANPYAKYTAATPTAPTVAPQGVSDAVANAFGQGATFNFGDELTAAVRSALPEFSNWMMKGPALQRDESIGGSPTPQTVSTGPNAYEDELAKVRAQTKADEAENPNLMTAANVAGSVAGSVPLLAAAPSALTAVSPSLLVNAAKLGTTGALLGGASGIGAGEGGIENRLANAVIPAAGGAVFGAATPYVGAGARSIAEGPVGRAVSRNVVDPIADFLIHGRAAGRTITPPTPPTTGGAPLIPPAPPPPPTEPVESIVRRGAMDRLATAAQRGRFDPQEGQTALTGLGPQAMPADINPALRGQAELANTMPGQTQTLAEQVLGKQSERYLGAPRRMTAALEGDQPPPSAFQLRGEGQAFDQNVTNVGRTAYGEATDAGLTQSPELRRMIGENPIISNAIDTQLALANSQRAGTALPPQSPIEALNEVQKMIRARGFVEGTAIPGPNMQGFRDLSNQYSSILRRDNPALDSAMRQYAEAKSLPKFYDTGANALRPAGATGAGIERSAPAIADVLQGATQNQALAARTGLINAARTQAQEGTPQTRALAERLIGSEPLQQKFAALSSPEHATSILRQSRTEQTFAETAKAVREGSPTARRMAQMAEEEGTPNIHLRADPRGLTARAYDATADFLRRVQAPNEAVRDEIGRLLLNTNAPQNAQFMQALARVLQQRQVGAGARAQAGAAAAGANQLNQVLQ